MGECSRENLDQSCEQAREQLTNSIRLQWRRLKNHMEKLDSQGTAARSHRLIPHPSVWWKLMGGIDFKT